MNKALSIIPAVVFLLCLVSGGLSYLLLPALPERVGNRPLAAAPTAHAGTAEWLQQGALWLRERMPLRLTGIQAKNAALLAASEQKPELGISPGNNAVFAGHKGWLFFDEDASIAPSKNVHREMAEKAKRLADRFTKAGHRFIFMPIPDKLSLFPDYAPGILRRADQWSQAADMPQQLRSAFSGDPCFIDLWSYFTDYRQQHGDDFWCPHDTHWNSKGGMLAVRQILDRLKPGLAQDGDFQAPTQQPMVNDLRSGLLLLPESGQLAPHYEVRRSVQPRRLPHESIPEVRSTPILHFECDHPDVIPGHTVVIMDSFMQSTPELMAPWFAKLTLIHETYATHPIMKQKLAQADTILWTSVERILRGRLDYWEQNH
jgi:hypothetical protein